MRADTFIGTATTLLRLGSFTVLADPNFLGYAMFKDKTDGCVRAAFVP